MYYLIEDYNNLKRYMLYGLLKSLYWVIVYIFSEIVSELARKTLPVRKSGKSCQIVLSQYRARATGNSQKLKIM